MRKPDPAAPAPADSNLPALRRDAEAIVHPVVAAAVSIVIIDAATYSEADAFLKRVRDARRAVEEKLEPIITPQRLSLENLYALRREMDLPLTKAEKMLKANMAAWEMAKARLAAEAKAEHERRTREIEKEAELARQRADSARTNEAAERQRALAETLAQKARTLAAARPAVEPTRAAHSTARTMRKPRVVDMTTFIAAVSAGLIPEAMLVVATTDLNTYYRAAPAEVAEWPGVEIVEEVVIAGR